MKNSKYILIIFLLTAGNILSQQNELDSTWNLEELDYENVDTIPEFTLNLSYGWFPKTPNGMLQLGLLSFQLGGIYDYANNIRSKAFLPTKNPFSGFNFMSDEQREMKEPNSNKTVRANSNMPFIGGLSEQKLYPDTDYGSFGFDYCYAQDLLFNYGIKLMVFGNKSMLFSKDESKNFLDIYGTKQKFTEASIIYLNEWSLNTGVTFELPIYGAFISSFNSIIGSYYFASAGLNMDYSFWSEGYQFLQIADAKDKIRYANGRDTIHLQTDVVFDGLNRLRFGLDFSLGWKYTSDPIGWDIELFTFIPLTSVLYDASWKQYRIGLRYKFIFFNQSIN